MEEVLEDDKDRAFIRAQRAAASKAEAEGKAKREREAFIAADIEDMQRRHPDVDIAALDANPAFRRFAGSRYAKEPLADLYEDFIEIVGDAAKTAAVRENDKRSRSTGHGGGGSSATLTAAQRAALKQWNEENPEMAMTEAEFAER